jgi:hypothetical protein
MVLPILYINIGLEGSFPAHSNSTQFTTYIKYFHTSAKQLTMEKLVPNTQYNAALSKTYNVYSKHLDKVSGILPEIKEIFMPQCNTVTILMTTSVSNRIYE